MALRTTVSEVRQIMDGMTSSEVSDADVTAFLTAANALVTKIIGDDGDLGSTLKEEIERYLTAHFIASTRFRTATEEKVGDVWARYTGKFGMNLESTPYGQVVLQLDFTGKMGAAVGKRGASIRAIKS